MRKKMAYSINKICFQISTSILYFDFYPPERNLPTMRCHCDDNWSFQPKSCIVMNFIFFTCKWGIGLRYCHIRVPVAPESSDGRLILHHLQVVFYHNDEKKLNFCTAWIRIPSVVNLTSNLWQKKKGLILHHPLPPFHNDCWHFVPKYIIWLKFVCSLAFNQYHLKGKMKQMIFHLTNWRGIQTRNFFRIMH